VSPFQISALLFTVLAPFAVWLLDRRIRSTRVLRVLERLLAVVLILSSAAEIAMKWKDADTSAATMLPMQLCDWALLLISAALWWHWKRGFEIAYFWGLAGTIQALFTPAIPADLAWLRACGFFFIHAGIVAGIFHLLLTQRWRPTPRSLLYAIGVSEIYLVVALAVNALTGGNYGFLSHKPPTKSLLDLFSDTHWIYILQINLVAVFAFALLYGPWFVADLIKGRRVKPPSAF
jgi:hypothetical integral membrane protein (TIGR02206 family)